MVKIIHQKNKVFGISIIEDSQIHSEWLTEKLKETDNLSILSIDKLGRNGIESVKRLQPSLLLLDFQLPDITGLEVAKRIKAYNFDIKIFATTAHAESSIIIRMIEDKNIDAIGIKGSHYFEENLSFIITNVMDGETFLDPSLLLKLRENCKAPIYTPTTN
jgi:DNA-binding NarL/FixJ family response regulator